MNWETGTIFFCAIAFILEIRNDGVMGSAMRGRFITRFPGSATILVRLSHKSSHRGRKRVRNVINSRYSYSKRNVDPPVRPTVPIHKLIKEMHIYGINYNKT
jgi:hypothetical protein